MTHVSEPLLRRDFLAEGARRALMVTGVAGDALAMTTATLSQQAPGWDLTWVERLTGKFRTVFDSPDIADGTVFVNAFVYYASFREVYAASDADAQAVLVMRGNGVHMALNTAVWEKYGLARELKIPGSANPYVGQVAALRQRGAILLACNIAATYYAGEIAKRLGADSAAVLADLKANLLPGVLLQPSGVFAAIRAQQAGCAFMKSA